MITDLTKLSDIEIVKFTYKNKEAFTEIIKRYEQKLLRYATYITDDNRLSEDIVQNTFIKAYVSLKGFNTSLSFSSWIYRITHNEAINAIKKNKRHSTVDVDAPSDAPSNLDEFSQDELKQMLSSCLENLPLKYSEVLTLFFLEEKSYEEISDILRLPIGTIGTRLSRGKAILKLQCLKQK